jgi:hypothetical protein
VLACQSALTVRPRLLRLLWCKFLHIPSFLNYVLTRNEIPLQQDPRRGLRGGLKGFLQIYTSAKKTISYKTFSIQVIPSKYFINHFFIHFVYLFLFSLINFHPIFRNNYINIYLCMLFFCYILVSIKN